MAGSIPAANGRDVLLKIFGRDKIPPAANAGLVFERYFPCWDASGRRRLAGTELRTALDEFVTEYNRRKNSAGEDLLSAGHARLRNAAGINGTRLRATARLAVGLGAEHPLENSLTFDRTSGAPVIPATSMKGLCRVSATLDSVESARLFTLFGSEDAQRDASGPRAVGDLIFFDALPRS
jgi:CRISPR-associated protein Cmr6